MNKKEAKKLYIKYLEDRCSPEELELLNKFLESYQKKNMDWPESEYGSEDELRGKMLIEIKTKIGINKKSKRASSKSYLKYAAIFVSLLGIAFFFQYNNSKKPGLIISDEAVILKLGNDEIKEIDSNDRQSIANKDGEVIGTQSGGQITYINNDKVKELVYNEIQVPKGKKFELILSDGTMVHLNSETSLKYPADFISGEKREVFLKGEAYFEVKKDAKHPFIVTANTMEVEVLGTYFNVNTYNKTEPFAVLVEGSVSISENGISNENKDAEIIVPGQKASVITDGIQIENVNVNNYIDWRNGNLTFIDLPFSEIVKKIERKYNVVIRNDFLELDEIKFKGRFEDETILDLLDVFKESAEFDYEIIDNQIMIVKP